MGLIIVYLFVTLITSINLLVDYYYIYSWKNKFFFTPTSLYKETRMNEIGCWICCIGLIFIFPWYCLVTFFYWLFHLGRN